MTETKIYPGMITNEIEMFVVENELKVIQNGKVSSFAELPYATMQLLREAIEADENVQLHLKQMHPASEYKRIEQFAMCRFGGLDFTGDISNNSKTLQDGEYWDCPLRGSCLSEGTLCKMPKVGTERLTAVEIKLIQLSTTDKTNDVIADEMQMPLGSFHKHKKEIHEKIGLLNATKQSLTKFAYLFNLI